MQHACPRSMTPFHGFRIAGALAALAVATDAGADPITLTELPHHVTAASLTVGATPAEIYQLVTDYAQWRAVFSDVRSVTVKSGDHRDAKVRFRSHALGHEVTVVFDNVPNHVIRFRGVEGPPGGRASGSYELKPVDGGMHTLIDAALYMDVVGLPSLFISDAKIRSMRQAKLRADLTDLLRRLPIQRPTTSAREVRDVDPGPR